MSPVGKIRLALEIGKECSKESVNLDLQKFRDLTNLEEPELFLKKKEGKLVIQNETHLVPGLFPELCGCIDKRCRHGETQPVFRIQFLYFGMLVFV